MQFGHLPSREEWRSAAHQARRHIVWKQAAMAEIFDIYTLLLLGLAIVIILRLRSVLGRKTGHEQQRNYDVAAERGEVAASSDKVVTLPRGGEPARVGAAPKTADDIEARIRNAMPNAGAVTDGLIDIARSDASFDPSDFLRGAKTAYEMIVTSFAEGNRKLLKTLLSRDVFEEFSNALAGRESRGESASTSFVGISKADIIEAELKNRTARVTVKFVSQLITAITNRSGEVIDGDPKLVREVTDIWTFAREISAKDPNWKLVATQAAN
jgi:predicted lipid-binding transport protein (Tim44 family)